MSALINGRAYDFSQIVVNIMDVAITGITEITYEETQEKTMNRGTGTRPNSMGVAGIESTGTITMSMNEVEKFRDAAITAGSTTGSLLDLEPFVITVNYNNAQKPITHTIRDVAFTKDGSGGALDDTEITTSLDIIFSRIDYR